MIKFWLKYHDIWKNMINKVGVNMQKIKGLTNQEVLDQIDLGHMNISPKPLVKTNKQIIFEHVFNLFNA